MYSGHSDGMYLTKHHIRLLRVEDFCYFAKNVIGRKADLFVFDCCLCGNINCISTCQGYTDYVIASTSYWSFLSILETRGIYEPCNDTLEYSKKIIRQLIQIEKRIKDAFVTNYCLYSTTCPELNECINIVLKYKDRFPLKKSYVMDKGYYKDIECEMRSLGLNVTPLLKKIVMYQRFKTKCRNTKVPLNANKSTPSSMLVVLKRPIKDIPTISDRFLI
jgi:hypothetical protein